MTKMLSARDILETRIADTDWGLYFIKQGDITRLSYRVQSGKELHDLGRHFGEAVKLKNRTFRIFNNTTRVGLIGLPRAGKTEISDGIIEAGGQFEQRAESERGQKTGLSEGLGFVCRVDCNTNYMMADYTIDKTRVNSQEEGRLELIEHCQEDFRAGERLHSLFIIKAVDSQMVRSPRDVDLLVSADLAQTQGFSRFVHKSRCFSL